MPSMLDKTKMFPETNQTGDVRLVGKTDIYTRIAISVVFSFTGEGQVRNKFQCSRARGTPSQGMKPLSLHLKDELVSKEQRERREGTMPGDQPRSSLESWACRQVGRADRSAESDERHWGYSYWKGRS